MDLNANSSHNFKIDQNDWSINNVNGDDRTFRIKVSDRSTSPLNQRITILNKEKPGEMRKIAMDNYLDIEFSKKHSIVGNTGSEDGHEN